MNNIHKVIVFYFSGTGNAERIAMWLCELIAKKKIDCEIFDISKISINNIIALIDNSFILIISPTHGFNYPKITLDFISHFPRGNNRVVLMNTRAGMKVGRFVTPGLSGITFFISSFILKRKGYDIVGLISFDMPSNWISIHPSLNEKSVKYIHKINYNRAEKHIEKIISGKRYFLAYRDLVQDIIISPVALGYYFIGRFVFAKSFYASTDCDYCGLCIKQCPVQAIITVNNHPFWTFKCESCMRCMNNCHKKAIQTAHGLIIIVSFLSSISITILFYNVLQFEIKSQLIRLLLWSGLFMTFLWIFYYLQHLLLKIRILSKLIMLTSLTYYKFWGRYKSIQDEKWKDFI